jgi:hypothetical protein
MTDLPPIVVRYVGDARELLAVTAEARAAVKGFAEESKRYGAEQTASAKQFQAEQAAATKRFTAEQKAETARFQAEQKASTDRYNAEQLAATRRYTAEQNAILRRQLAEQKAMRAKAAEESDLSKALGKAAGRSPLGAAVGGEAFMGLGPAGMAVGATTVVVGALAAGVAAVGYESLKMAANFEQATTRLVTSAGESHANIDMVRKGMVDMAGQVGYSAQELAKAMYTVESGTFHGADALKVLRASAEGAKAENADLSTVTNAVTSVLVDYHLKADDAAMVTTKLVAATSAGKTTFEQLTGAMHAVMPAASAAHVPLNDILGDLASMTVHGMSAEQAAQNLTDVIRHMENPTAVQAKELALLGLTTTQLADDLKSKGLSGTLQEISDHIRKLAPPGTDKVILDLRTALQGLSPQVRELGLQLFNGSLTAKEYAKAAQDLDPISAKQAVSFATLAGSTHRIGDQQLTGAQVMQNYSQALAKATGDATGLNVALMLTGDNAGTTTDAIKTVTDATTEAGNHVKGWSDIQSTLNQQISQFKAGLEAIGIRIGEKLMPIVKEAMADFVDFGKKVSATFDRPDVKAALDNLNSALDKMSKDVLKSLKKDLDDLAKFIDKNHVTISRFINFVANDVIPVLGFLAKVTIGGLVSDIKILIVQIGYWQAAFDTIRSFTVGWAHGMAALWLGYVDTFLTAADKAFGWIPGLGPKFDQALRDFHRFRDGVLSDIDSLNGKRATMYVDTVYNPGVPDRAVRAGSIQLRAAGGPVEPGRTYVVGEDGPEILQMGNNGGHVFSTSQSRGMVGGMRAAAARNSGAAGGVSAPGGQPIVVQLVADGRKLYEVIVPHAQRHKGRNTSTVLA